MNKQDWPRRLDAELSFITWTQENKLQVMRGISQKGGIVVKRKLSLALTLALVLLALTATAYAAGLIFSPRVDTLTLADQALKEKYGIDQAMLSYFTRDMKESGGATVVTYKGFDIMEYPLGVYTVTVKNGKTEVQWSHDGKDTSGGLDGDVWGLEQLKEIVEISKTQHEAKAYFNKAMEVNQRNGISLEATELGRPTETEEEYRARREKEEDEIRARKKLTEEEMKELASQAVMLTYHLTEEQAKKFDRYDEGNWYHFVHGSPCYDVFFGLCQRPGPEDDPDAWPEWTEGDGQYWVSVNVETGVIEDIIYDSGLNGNG